MAVPDELERLYDEHAQAVFAYLINFTRSEDDIRDLLQELFLKLARHPGLIRRARDRRAFLLRMAHNSAVDLFRRRRTDAKHRVQLAAGPAALFAPAWDPDERVFQDALSAALGELPARQRAVVYQRLWEGLTFRHIAKLMSIRPNTAASRYRYGLDKLRQRLRPLYDEIK